MAKRLTMTWLGWMLALGVVGCGGDSMDSTWRTSEIKIDGDASDWSQVRFLEKDGLKWALINDDTYLYACLITQNSQVRNQIMLQGLTVWFDPRGGDNKAFGIRFPLGLSESEESMATMRRMRQSGQADQAKLMAEFEASLTVLEMWQSAGALERLAVEESQGFEIRIGISLTNSLIYELKLPLARTNEVPYAVGAVAGTKVGIGLDSPEFDRQALQQKMGGVGRTGRDKQGGGMRGGGAQGGGRDGRSGTRPELPEALEAWGKVQLAERPQPS